MEPDTREGLPQQSTTKGPGAALYGAREQRRMSIEEAARALNLSPRHIAAIEADDYDALSGPTYIRGYLRGYAQLLGLDPEPLIQRYNTAYPGKQETPDLGTLAPRPQASSNDGLVKLGSVVVAGLVFGLAVVWWVGREEKKPDVPTPALAPVLPPQADSLAPSDASTLLGTTAIDLAVTDAPANGLPSSPVLSAGMDQRNAAAPTAPSSERGVSTPPTIPVIPPPVVKKEAASSMAAPATASTPRPAPPASTAATVAPAPRVKLLVHAAQESWVDIRDARQSKLLYETLAPGRSVTVEGVAPLNVFVGNAEGVTVEFNGSPVDITPFRRGQIARFSLPLARSGNNSGLLGP